MKWLYNKLVDRLLCVWVSVMWLLTLMLLPAVSWAAETQAFWQATVAGVLELVAAILVPILGVLGAWLAWKIGVKIEMDKLNWALDKGIGFAEQWAKNQLNEGKPPTKNDIKMKAVVEARRIMAEYGIGKKIGDALGSMIEARLGEQNRTVKPPAGLSDPEA